MSNNETLSLTEEEKQKWIERDVAEALEIMSVEVQRDHRRCTDVVTMHLPTEYLMHMERNAFEHCARQMVKRLADEATRAWERAHAPRVGLP